MSISVNSIAPPPTVLQQVATAINAVNNETPTRDVVLDPSNLLLGYKTVNKSFGGIFVNGNTTSTVITAASTMYLFQNSGLQLNTLSSNFSLSAGASPALSSRLTYNGSASCPFKISCNVTYLCAGANQQNVACALFQNGVLIPSSKQSSNTVNANFSKSLTMDVIVSMAPNDYVELYLSNTTASNNITCSDVNMTVVSLH